MKFLSWIILSKLAQWYWWQPTAKLLGKTMLKPIFLVWRLEKTRCWTGTYPHQPSFYGRVLVSGPSLWKEKCHISALIQSLPQNVSCAHFGTSMASTNCATFPHPATLEKASIYLPPQWLPCLRRLHSKGGQYLKCKYLKYVLEILWAVCI